MSPNPCSRFRRRALARISVEARPVEGRANKEAIKLIAHAFSVPQKSVKRVRGVRSRRKVFRMTGLEFLPEDLKTLVEKGKWASCSIRQFVVG